MCENRSDDGGLETFYTYDANGNLLTHIAASADGIAGAQTERSMAEISRFFERDARRYGG